MAQVGEAFLAGIVHGRRIGEGDSAALRCGDQLLDQRRQQLLGERNEGEAQRAAHTEEYAEQIEAAAGGRDKRVILVCGQGNRSARTADALRNEHGFERAASVIGGVTLWTDLGSPIEGEIVVGADDVELERSMEGDTT